MFHMMSEHADQGISAIINKIGYASIAAGGTNAVVTKAIETSDPSWVGVSNFAGIISIVGGVVFIIKLISDMYYTRKRDKREEKAVEGEK